MTSHYHLSQFHCKLLELRVNFYHWWNSNGIVGNPERHPDILTRRLKNIPLISLRNSECAAYLVAVGYDKGSALGSPVRSPVQLPASPQVKKIEPLSKKISSPERRRFHGSYQLRVVEQLDAPPVTKSGGSEIEERLETPLPENQWEDPQDPENSPIEEQYPQDGVKRNRSITRFFPFRAKKMKFIKTPPLEESDNEVPPPPPPTKPQRQVSIIEPNEEENPKYHEFESDYYDSMLVDAGRRGENRRAFSDITNSSTMVFRPLKAILKRDFGEMYDSGDPFNHARESMRVERPASRHSVVSAPGRKSTRPGSHLFTTIINDISLNAALQANGLAPRRRITKQVNPDFTNLNDYTSIMSTQSKRYQKQERPLSMESYGSHAFVIGPEADLASGIGPMTIVLENAGDRRQSTLNYGTDIIADYQLSDRTFSRGENVLVSRPHTRDEKDHSAIFVPQLDQLDYLD
ncbi:hypothetical protein OGAPHI_003771 [Ogataea philodendri]|uniref:Uncharacterized protein n=1 Tax=Ogataea philodendri TaxID=1378263 RepID=A0A9P8T4T4_9ASCO|nr:uncharacterized protein OGAPHI_003771 [Ogataea philodendri]KAH3665584.1 hypothetical protein OGAPHI_003771 [Ogataea philodendri]